MGNRRNGIGCGFGDSRINLYHDEKMSAYSETNAGQNQSVLAPFKLLLQVLKKT